MDNKNNQEFSRIKRPKRRKNKDNPYTLFVRDERFFVSFRDGEGIRIETELTREQYLLFDRFELEDKKEANERERHYEQSEQYETTLFHRAAWFEEEPVEDAVLERLEKEALREALWVLPATQRRRLVMYYFGGLTYDEIAEKEHCTKMPVKRSIDAALEKIKKFLEMRGYFWLKSEETDERG